MAGANGEDARGGGYSVSHDHGTSGTGNVVTNERPSGDNASRPGNKRIAILFDLEALAAYNRPEPLGMTAEICSDHPAKAIERGTTSIYNSRGLRSSISPALLSRSTESATIYT